MFFNVFEYSKEMPKVFAEMKHQKIELQLNIKTLSTFLDKFSFGFFHARTDSDRGQREELRLFLSPFQTNSLPSWLTDPDSHTALESSFGNRFVSQDLIFSILIQSSCSRGEYLVAPASHLSICLLWIVFYQNCRHICMRNFLTYPLNSCHFLSEQIRSLSVISLSCCAETGNPDVEVAFRRYFESITRILRSSRHHRSRLVFKRFSTERISLCRVISELPTPLISNVVSFTTSTTSSSWLKS